MPSFSADKWSSSKTVDAFLFLLKCGCERGTVSVSSISFILIFGREIEKS
jgi:hypothetical protein